MVILAMLMPGSLRAGHSVWTPLGPEGAKIASIAVDPVTPGTLYAAGFGVFKSTDWGETWIAIENGLPNNYFFTIVVNPISPESLYVGSNCCGVFKSMDGGASWSPSGTGLSDKAIFALAMNPQDPSTLYAGGPGLAYKTTDGGATWVPSGNGLPDIIFAIVMSFAINPANPETVYAGVGGSWGLGGVFKTTDGGLNWMETGLGCDFHALAIDGVTPDTLYAGGCGLYKTTDGANSWTNLDENLPLGIFSIVIDPHSKGTVYIGGLFGAFRSTDAGASWAAMNNGLPNDVDSTLFCLAGDPQGTGTLYAGRGGDGIWSITQIGPIIPGDCDGDGQVTIGEVQRAINMFLGTKWPDCNADCNGDGEVSIGELQKAINVFLGIPASC
jgi:photosystem II stability/assembly factor-like uncharacterized protein